jgi:hypothetical protein
VKDASLLLGNEPDRGKRRLGIEEVDALEQDAKCALNLLERMAADAAENQLLPGACFDVSLR